MIDSVGVGMSVASCLCLWAPLGPGSALTRRTRRIHPWHKPVCQRRRYPNGAVCQSKPSLELQVDQARLTKSMLKDPTVLTRLRAVSFDCWKVDLERMLERVWRLRHADNWGLPEGLYQKLTPQEQAEHMSIFR